MASDMAVAGSSSSSVANELMKVMTNVNDADMSTDLDEMLATMAKEKKRKKAEAAKIARECKNLAKKKGRLMKKAKALTSNDLLQVWKLREVAAGKKEKKNSDA
jgi:membrane protease subunit (stomatin/prohibitin family)